MPAHCRTFFQKSDCNYIFSINSLFTCFFLFIFFLIFDYVLPVLLIIFCYLKPSLFPHLLLHISRMQVSKAGFSLVPSSIPGNIAFMSFKILELQRCVGAGDNSAMLTGLTPWTSWDSGLPMLWIALFMLRRCRLFDEEWNEEWICDELFEFWCFVAVNVVVSVSFPLLLSV